MEYTNIKGFRISRLTLGTVALGIDYGVFQDQHKPNEKERNSIIRAAINSGINTFDTAREYGDAEELLGRSLLLKKRTNEINIVTKFKIQAENAFNYKSFRADVYRSVQASLKRLALQQLPICLFHMASSLDIRDVLQNLKRTLRDLKRDELIRAGGISIDHPLESEHCIDEPEIEVMQIPLNVFDQRLIKSGFLGRLQQSNKIIFARSVFLRGLFFRSADELAGNLKGAAPYLEKLQEFADRSGMTKSQFAFSYIRDLDGVSSLVFGAERTSQVEANIKLLETRRISPEIREEAELFFQSVPDTILTPRMWII